MFTLIAMGTGVAWLYSVVAALMPNLFPAAFRDAEGAVSVYFEAAAVITVLVLLGQVLELRAREATSGAIRALLDAPKTAAPRKDDGNDRRSRSTRYRSATGCACVPATRSRWMASSSKAARRSMNPW
jgi:Cu+-exporting ATPase